MVEVAVLLKPPYPLKEEEDTLGEKEEVATRFDLGPPAELYANCPSVVSTPNAPEVITVREEEAVVLTTALLKLTVPPVSMVTVEVPVRFP